MSIMCDVYEETVFMFKRKMCHQTSSTATTKQNICNKKIFLIPYINLKYFWSFEHFIGVIELS